MQLRLGEFEVELGSPYLGTLRESNDLLADFAGLRSRLASDGYLLLRGLHDRETVQSCRDFLLQKLAENEQIDPTYPTSDGVVRSGAKGGFHGGSKTLTRDPLFLNVVESERIMGFFAELLQGDSITFDYKWLRVVAPGDFTGAHYDVVYMGRGTHNLYTCWTPITDVPYNMGPLAILAGSHIGEGYEKIRQTYGQMDVDRDNVAGWFTNNPIEMVDRYGGQWQTTEFQMGDALIFGMYTMHISLTNTSNRYRISCDTRYQRADEPVDPRWIGENPLAHYAWMKGEVTSMEEMRKKWEV